MIKTRLYLDLRRLDSEMRGKVRIIISKNSTSAMISLGISVREDQFDHGIIVNHENANILNQTISIKKGQIDKYILEFDALDALVGKDAKEICELIKKKMDPNYQDKSSSFAEYFETYASRKTNQGTRTLYFDTLKKIRTFCAANSISVNRLKFDNIDQRWLESFEGFCLTTEAQNTASRHLRDIRAAFNAAIDDGLTSTYPFRRFKIKKEESFDKSFTSGELRQLFNAECYPGGQEEAIDMFKLMFCLIGINCVDLYNAGKVERGRLNYIRKKTHKPYSIKIEPEAAELIEKYAGKISLINIKERCPNYKTYFNRMIKTLKRVGKQRIAGKRSTGDAILPDVCTGSARTSWATIAQEELDIPRDVIAAALGHHTIDVTTTYLRTDWRKKVDRANRLVMDWVLYGKKNRY